MLLLIYCLALTILFLSALWLEVIVAGYGLDIFIVQVVKQSRKFCPEAIIFLRTLLMVALDGNSKLSRDSQVLHFF